MSSLSLNEYPVNGVGPYSLTFEYQRQEDVNVSLYNSTTELWDTQARDDWSFVTPTSIQLGTAPAANFTKVRVYRLTEVERMRAQFYQGSAIRAQDLNNNFEQLLFSLQEEKDEVAIIEDQLEDKISNKVDDVFVTAPLTRSLAAESKTITIGITESSSTEDGYMSQEDKAKLDSMAEGAQVNTITGVAPVEVGGTGTDPEISMKAANSTRDGYMPKEYAAKLDSVEFVEVHNAVFAEGIDGVRTTFTLDHQANSAYDLTVSINGIIQQANVHYTWDAQTSQITFISPPPINSEYWITISGFQMADGTVGGFQTTATLPLGTQPGDGYAVAMQYTEPYEEVEDDLVMQSDVNHLVADLSKRASKNVARAYDLVDFTQNTGTQGYWVHTEDEGGGDVPQQAEFFAFDEDGNQTQQFADVRSFKFNDAGLAGNPGTENKLETARIGDQLVVQETVDNHFGQYIITGILTENSNGVIYRTFDVKVYKNGQRAFGDVQYLAHCSVRVMRPEYVIVQDDQPSVSSRGVLWYREADDHLFISNYADGFTGVGPQWTDLTASGGGGDSNVHVGENPPAEEEGALWFDTNRLELYVYYVEEGEGGWLPSSPLGARVSAGEALQQQILGRVNGHDNALDDLYANQLDFIRRQISNDVTTSFRIKSGGNTLISTSGNKLGLYNLSEPTNPTHAVNLGYADTNYLSIPNGGTINNLTVVDRESGTAFKVKKSGVDHVKIEAGGKIFCNYNMELDDDDTTVPNKGWVKSRLPKFSDAEYGSNFLCKYGISTTNLNNGEVMFLGAQLNSITQPSSIRCIAFSESGFNWDACLKSGVVKVNVGANNAGFYQIYNMKVNGGRNVLLYVKPIEFDDSQVLEEDTGTPCYFQGVFFE